MAKKPVMPGKLRFNANRRKWDLQVGQKNEIPLREEQISPSLRKARPTKEVPVCVVMSGRDVASVHKPLDGFHNPYNFIPTPDRAAVTGPLGDVGNESIGQHMYHADRYSGRLVVRMEARTPLLVPDAAASREIADDHKIFPPLRADGQPTIPPTSVRGMLRSAYEAITNSRLGVFAEHGEPLSNRMPAKEGLHMVPARMGKDGRIQLLTGTTKNGSNKIAVNTGREIITKDVMMAAWLPAYRKYGNVKYKDGRWPAHGDPVVCWIVLRTPENKNYAFYEVVRIAHKDNEGGLEGCTIQEAFKIDGWVSRTKKNIKNKHDERVFFCDQEIYIDDPQAVEAVKAMWRAIVNDYNSLHRAELGRGETAPPALAEYCCWSQHIFPPASPELTPGTLFYVELEGGRNNLTNPRIVRVSPVMIGRHIPDRAPADLLPDSLKPARRLTEMSPADRVFGWVAAGRESKGEGAWRGQLRVGAVQFDPKLSPDPSLTWWTKDRGDGGYHDPNGLPLANLASPKPSQARFYVGDKGQAPLGNTKKRHWYSDGQALRGRKIYPHHGIDDPDYWTTVNRDSPRSRQNAPYQEFLRPADKDLADRDSQNRSVEAWINPGVTFTFTLHVTNLSKVELGALLWLLTLNDDAPDTPRHLRLGGGKPLGFGSVTLHLENAELYTGAAMAERYRSLTAPAAPDATDLADIVEAYRQAVAEAYAGAGKDFASVGFIRAFLAAAVGPEGGAPVHYPRIATLDVAQQEFVAPPRAESYEWFVENEKGRQSLPSLAGGKSLSYLYKA